MDPITTAIVSALIYDLSKTSIQKSYKALKTAIEKKFGSQSDLVDAVNKLELKPESKGRQATLLEEVEAVKANEVGELVKLAQDLLEQLKEKPSAQQVMNVNARDNAAVVGHAEAQTQFIGGTHAHEKKQ